MKAGTYRISSGFGPRWGTIHRGVDFAAPSGMPMYAAENGVVVDSRDGVGGFGCWIVIDHVINGKKVSTVYGHMYKQHLFVRKGQTVKAGQLISYVGNNGDSSGPHLHFEVWLGGRLTGGTAVDPMGWIGGTPTVPTTSTVIKIGDVGPAVLKLQTFMTRMFSSYNNYVPDGHFGKITEAGIMEFQRRVGLTADGIVGPATLAALAKYGYK